MSKTEKVLDKLGFMIDTYWSENTTYILYLDEYWVFKVNWYNLPKYTNEIEGFTITELKAGGKGDEEHTISLPLKTIEQVEIIINTIKESIELDMKKK